MKSSVHYRCACTGPDGKPAGQRCPKLWRKDGHWNPRHGSAGWAARIPTTLGTKLVKKFGYKSKADADAAAEAAGKLLDLAGADDATRRKIGDVIVAARRGAPLPALEEVAQRVSLRQDPGSAGVLFGGYWAGWLADKRKLRASSHRRLAQIGEHWLLPVLADVPLERLSGEDCKRVFRRILSIDSEIARQQGRGPC